MSLQAAAQHMASQGRGPDTTLVHMSPKEVRSLQELAMAHGGSLTINPKTGLPEAGFLSALLPMIAGFALGPAGFALMSAPMAGLTVGGIQALRTGNIGKGIMAGLGAYGGAGLGEAFAQTGAQAAAGVPEAANQLGALTATSTPDQIVAAQQAAAQAAQKVSAAQSAPFMDRLGDVGRGFQSLGSEAGRSSFMQNVGGAKGLLQTGGAAAAPLFSSMLEPKTKTPAPVDSEQMRFSYDPRRKTPPTREGDVGEYTYFDPTFTRLSANGGLMDAYAEGGYTYDPKTQQYSGGPAQTSFNTGGGFVGRIKEMIESGQLKSGDIENMYTYDPATQTYAATPAPQPPPAQEFVGDQWQAAQGGISNLGDYSDGGRLLRGPGDGVSDDIPAMIANKRPARLADGEFVVPARIVSELGNGSTEAGARKLYAMMDRIQKNRSKSVGKGKVAVNSRSERMLPA